MSVSDFNDFIFPKKYYYLIVNHLLSHVTKTYIVCLSLFLENNLFKQSFVINYLNQD